MQFLICVMIGFAALEDGRVMTTDMKDVSSYPLTKEPIRIAVPQAQVERHTFFEAGIYEGVRFVSWEVDETEVWDGATMYSFREVGGRRFLSEGFSHVLYEGKLLSMVSGASSSGLISLLTHKSVPYIGA